MILMALSLPAISCDRGRPAEKYPRAIKGMLDLREWDFDRMGPLPISGEWEFYWNELLGPQRFIGGPAPQGTGFAAVPGVWKDHPVNGAGLPGSGYATYRLRVLLEGPRKDLAIRTNTMSSAFIVYVNGTAANRAGSVGKSPADSKPGCSPQVRMIRGGPGSQLDILLQVSNFHYRTGGPWRQIWLGKHEDLADGKWSDDMKSIFLFGCLFIMFLYHTALFLMRRQDRHFLYLALLCLFISLRPLFTGEYVITRIYPEIPFDMIIRGLYLSYFCAIPAANYLFKSLFPGECIKRQTEIVLGITALFALAVILTPPLIFTHIIFAFFFFSIIVLAFIIAENILAVKRKRKGAVIILAGVIAMTAATINDNLYSSYFISTVYMADITMTAFLFGSALLLSLRLTGAFTRIEILSRELTGLNTGLERQVNERTRELQAAYESIKAVSIRDPLTGCFNRRFMEERLPEEVERALRYGRPLSIIMGDIDHFKSINDTHGHQAGDAVLSSISRSITDTMRDKIDWVCRYGGDEFIIIMPETPPAGSSIVAERIRARIENTPVEAGGSPISISMTFGVTGFATSARERAISMEELLESADRMLYKAKNEGRNRVVTGSYPDIGDPGAAS